MLSLTSLSINLFQSISCYFNLPRARGQPRHRDALQNVNENLVLFVFGVILSWSNLWQMRMVRAHGYHMAQLLALAFGLDGTGKRSSFVKAYAERGETFSHSP